MIRSVGFALSLAALTTVAAVPAQARPTDRTVSYADLDLSNPADSATLRGRIHTAAQDVCASSAGIDRNFFDCVRKVEAEAVGRYTALAASPAAPRRTAAP